MLWVEQVVPFFHHNGRGQHSLRATSRRVQAGQRPVLLFLLWACRSVYASEHKAVGDRFGAGVYLVFTGRLFRLVIQAASVVLEMKIRAGVFEGDDGASGFSENPR